MFQGFVSFHNKFIELSTLWIAPGIPLLPTLISLSAGVSLLVFRQVTRLFVLFMTLRIFWWRFACRRLRPFSIFAFWNHLRFTSSSFTSVFYPVGDTVDQI